MNIVILGPQGSGKGTQAELIAKKYNLLHIETGKILREIADTDHPLAEEIRNTMVEGRLVSDKILEIVIGDVLKTENINGFLFDGTPRDIDQYRLINKILAQKDQKIDLIILIKIPEEETIRRLTSRRTCEKCGNVYNIVTNPSPNGDLCECGGKLIQREDDFPEAIRKRLKTYHERTSLVISQAEKDGILREVNGSEPIDVVFDQIVKIIDPIYKPRLTI